MSKQKLKSLLMPHDMEKLEKLSWSSIGDKLDEMEYHTVYDNRPFTYCWEFDDFIDRIMVNEYALNLINPSTSPASYLDNLSEVKYGLNDIINNTHIPFNHYKILLYKSNVFNEMIYNSCEDEETKIYVTAGTYLPHKTFDEIVDTDENDLLSPYCCLSILEEMEYGYNIIQGLLMYGDEDYWF